jgi:hypothetical protein
VNEGALVQGEVTKKSRGPSGGEGPDPLAVQEHSYTPEKPNIQPVHEITQLPQARAG